MSDFSFRRDLITKPIFGVAKRALPSLSNTEREAIEAGDVWWDADHIRRQSGLGEAPGLSARDAFGRGRRPSSPARSKRSATW